MPRVIGSGIISGSRQLLEDISELMLGIKRRRRTEGWAVETGKGEAVDEHLSAWQRLAESNKLWIVSVVAVVLLTMVYVRMCNRTISRVPPPPPPRDAPTYFKNPERYTEFADQFAHDKQFSGLMISARFITPGRFRIVVPGTIGADDVDYMSKMAAERVRHEFQHKTIVLVYVKRAGDKSVTLVATTQWMKNKSGYVVRMHEAADRVL